MPAGVPRILNEAEKAKMRERYASLSEEEYQKELARALVLKKKRRAQRRTDHAADEESRRDVFLKHLDAVENAWAAGFWEGEGSVGKRHFLATQKSRWPLERLVANFGGRISDSSRRKDGCWQWHICGEQGRAFGMAIMRHLSPRRIEQINRIFLWRPNLAMPSHYKPILSIVKKDADAIDS